MSHTAKLFGSEVQFETGSRKTLSEVLARLVAAAVFKTVARRVNPVVGGFDSHALPLFDLHVVVYTFRNREPSLGGSYPFHFSARSRYLESSRRRTVPKSEQLLVAQRMKQELEVQDEFTIELRD